MPQNKREKRKLNSEVEEDLTLPRDIKKQKTVKIPLNKVESKTANKTTRKKSNKKNKDGNWKKSDTRRKPRGKKANTHSNLPYLRTEVSFTQPPAPTAMMDIEPPKKRRFAIFIEDNLFITYALDVEEAKTRMLNSFADMTTTNREKGKEFTPTKLVTNVTVTEFSLMGSPLAGETPGGSKFKRLHTGYKSPITILTDDLTLAEADVEGNRKALEQANVIKSFYESNAYKSIVPNDTASKEIIFEITPDQQKKVAKEIDENGGGRKKGQAQIMAVDYKHVKDATATKLLEASGIFEALGEPVKGEWSDLGAHSLTGNDSRTEKNLIATPQAPNTIMLIGPESLLHVLKRIYDKIDVTVLASTIESFKVATHIGDQIFYKIETEHFKLEFLIDALNTKKPHIMIKFANDIAYKVFIDMIQEKHGKQPVQKKLFDKKEDTSSKAKKENKENKENKTPNIPHSATLFYHKQPIEKDTKNLMPPVNNKRSQRRKD